MVWKLILAIFAGLVIGLMFPNTVHAVGVAPATFQGNQAVCANLAQIGGEATEFRDAGIPWKVFGPWLAERLNEALTDKDSYVKDSSDAQYILESIKRVWDEPQADAAVIANGIHEKCMRKLT